MGDLILSRYRGLRAHIDSAWLATLVVLSAIALSDPAQFWPSVAFAAQAYFGTLPFILFAVGAIAYLKASGAEALLAKAFDGRETRMILMAALLGGLSPFCSCEVIPFIAALLAIGAPLSAVMAFWLASPLMDPAMFSITAGTLGLKFAIAKTIAAIGLGLFGGAVVMAMKASALFTEPLRERPSVGGCCGVKKPFQGRPVWQIWSNRQRRGTFRETALENLLFLTKWLVLAYVLESVMLQYLPAEWIAGRLGGTGAMPVILGALLGAPAYLNGYAAVPLVGALMDQGMAPGAAMAFIIAGGVSCVPAAVAVWALVKPRVFAAYLGLAILGAMIAGGLWSLWA